MLCLISSRIPHCHQHPRQLDRHHTRCVRFRSVESSTTIPVAVLSANWITVTKVVIQAANSSVAYPRRHGRLLPPSRLLQPSGHVPFPLASKIPPSRSPASHVLFPFIEVSEDQRIATSLIYWSTVSVVTESELLVPHSTDIVTGTSFETAVIHNSKG